ncbi:MAG: exosortase/archaeosortase family protein [Candidatus Omnitrophica bacterium]|nr:exosortase/archaeosortase family protein [Candidatus Omnitrophota bacterium]
MSSSAVRGGPHRLAWTLPWIAAGVALCWPTMRWMAERFEAPDSFYSHGWLILVASGWLLWKRRARLAALPASPTYDGLWVLVPSLAVYVMATWWRIHVVAGLSLLGILWGLVWTLWGRAVAKVARFPLAFLVFMVPLPGILLIAISFQMKLLAAAIATWLLNLIGMPATQAGSTIQVPGVSVIVDDTCSGLRSLISLLALSIFWTALLPPVAARWQKLSLVAASVPIALLGNMVRILVLVLVAVIYGAKAAEGFIHYGSGMVVFGVAIVVLVWLSNLLMKRSR